MFHDFPNLAGHSRQPSAREFRITGLRSNQRTAICVTTVDDSGGSYVVSFSQTHSDVSLFIEKPNVFRFGAFDRNIDSNATIKS